jgi:acetyltransferase-like isoleucine patch superfamily enzyme
MRGDGFKMNGGRLAAKPGLRISEYAVVAPYGGHIEMGENVYLGPHSVIYGHGGLYIGDNVLIAAHVVIVPANHGYGDVDTPIRMQQSTAKGITIGNGSWIGAGARLLDGVTVGKDCIVAAGAVVTTSVPDRSVVAGVPAKIVRNR